MWVPECPVYLLKPIVPGIVPRKIDALVWTFSSQIYEKSLSKFVLSHDIKENVTRMQLDRIRGLKSTDRQTDKEKEVTECVKLG